MYECRGRIQGDYPIYIPKDSLLAEKIVQVAHIRTIHGGVSLTMGEVKMRCKKAVLERGIQHLHPMELTCSSYTATKEVILDPDAQVFFSSKRNAAVAANERIKEARECETELPDVE